MSRTPMPSIRQPRVKTLAQAYADIRAGAMPLVALNEFFHEWFDYSREQRAALVSNPIRPERHSPIETGNGELWRWAVFCAGAADYLCRRYDVAHPSWVDDQAFTLAEPWYGFGDPGAQSAEMRAYLEQTTPEPLRRRNVLSGNRVFANKYDFAEQARHRAATGRGAPEPSESPLSHGRGG